MESRVLFLKDKDIFGQFLNLEEHLLSVYHFSNIFIWKGLFEIFWQIIEDSLCVFFKDAIGTFLYFPPLSESLKLEVIEACFKIMDEYNLNPEISRIENVEERSLAFFQRLGYNYYSKPGDYLCSRDELVGLAGRRYKSQRAAYNYFVGHYQFNYQPFDLKERDAALMLYQDWKDARKQKFSNPVYQRMLEDNLVIQSLAIQNFAELGLKGCTIKIGDKLCAYSFGFRLKPDTFCILSEICDLSFKGISQFIFRQFCRELSDYQYINIMDDSDLENLRKVKLSYHPIRVVPNYVVKR